MSTDWSTTDIPDQTGRVALVTGANSGLGFATAQALAAAGATVLLGCRRRDAAISAAARIQAHDANADVRTLDLDLGDLTSVATAAGEVLGAHDRLDLLVNNAGLMAVPFSTTADGFEIQFGVNHVGHFALTGRLLSRMLETEGSRIVTVSSQAHRGPAYAMDAEVGADGYQTWKAYSRSKLANLLFTRELHARLVAADATTVAVAAHPGYAATELQTKGPKLAGSGFRTKLMEVATRVLGQSAADGALPQLRAATDPAVAGGEYYGPKGIGQQHGAPVKVGTNAAARDEVEARRLWALSEELTGVTYPV